MATGKEGTPGRESPIKLRAPQKIVGFQLDAPKNRLRFNPPSYASMHLALLGGPFCNIVKCSCVETSTYQSEMHTFRIVWDNQELICNSIKPVIQPPIPIIESACLICRQLILLPSGSLLTDDMYIMADPVSYFLYLIAYLVTTPSCLPYIEILPRGIHT